MKRTGMSKTTLQKDSALKRASLALEGSLGGLGYNVPYHNRTRLRAALTIFINDLVSEDIIEIAKDE